MEDFWYAMEWNCMEILPVMEDGRFPFHSMPWQPWHHRTKAHRGKKQFLSPWILGTWKTKYG